VGGGNFFVSSLTEKGKKDSYEKKRKRAQLSPFFLSFQIVEGKGGETGRKKKGGDGPLRRYCPTSMRGRKGKGKRRRGEEEHLPR